MDLDYVPVKVTTIRNERDGHIVEVHEADRPKPKLDSRSYQTIYIKIKHSSHFLKILMRFIFTNFGAIICKEF